MAKGFYPELLSKKGSLKGAYKALLDEAGEEAGKSLNTGIRRLFISDEAWARVEAEEKKRKKGFFSW